MRVVRIEANWDTFLWTVAGHELNRVTSDLPADAKVLNIDIDPARRAMFFTVESASFPDSPEGRTIPPWQPTLKVEVTEMSMLADLVSKKYDAIEKNCTCGYTQAAHVCPNCEDCGQDMSYHECPT